jgi:hypothetical protein
MNLTTKIKILHDGILSAVFVINIMFFIMGIFKDIIYLQLLFWINFVIFAGLSISLGEKR